MKINPFKIILLLSIILSLSSNKQCYAQTTVVINQLHDTLQPKISYLKNAPPPKVKRVPPLGAEGAPKIHTFAPNIAQGKGFFTTYTTNDGLAIDAIGLGKSTLCDSEGNIWFATQGGGVSKYDGKSFTTFTAEQGLANNVRSIAEDKTGNLWFGTDGGVSKYDGKLFTTFTTEQGLANNIVLSIAADKTGNLWFGTNGGGVSKYDGKSFTTFTTEQGLANSSVLSIAEDKTGNLWFGTNGGGVSKYDGKSFTTFTTEQGLANNRVFSIAEDKTGNLWFGTDGGVSKYDGKSFSTFTTEQGLANNSVFSIAEDKTGNLWFGTNGGGVSKLVLSDAEGSDGKSFTTFTTEQGLANNSVWSIAEDKTGNLWFGTYGGGVSKYDGKSFSTFTTEQDLANNSVLSIAEDKTGNLWFGTDGGVSKYDGKSFTTFTTEQGLANSSVLSIAEDKTGNLWFGTNVGVSKYDGKSFTTFTTEQGLANNRVFSIAEDKTGNLWFGTDGGVSKYDGKSFTTFTTEQGLANNRVFSIAEDKTGNLWFGTDGGVSKYDGKSFTTFTTEQGLANNSVWSIAEDKTGNLWFGTYGRGVSILLAAERVKLVKEHTPSPSQEGNLFLTVNNLNGLPDNGICAIRQDDKGRMIIGTNFGLAVIPAQEVKRITTSLLEGDSTAITSPLEGGLRGVTIYNQFTGYPIRDVNAGQNNGAMYVDSKGILWVGHGSNGVTRIDLDAVHKSTSPPNVVINKVSLKGEDVCWYSLKAGALLRDTKQSDSNGEIASSIALPRNNEWAKDSTTLAQQEIATYGKVLTQAERDTLQQRFAGVKFDGITKWYPLPENLVLPYEHNALTFEFKAIETGRNFMVNYQYALVEGKHTPSPSQEGNIDWSPITKKHEAVYNNLWEGEYTFLLKAQSPFGIWSKPIAYHFKVLPPWFRTWWAYCSYAVFLVFGMWFLVRLQTKRLKQRQKELEHEVEMATVEIRTQKEKVEKAHEKLAEHHQEIQDSINYAKRIQDAIMPNMQVMNTVLKDGFVLYKPKDIVAGDFFWLEQKEDVVYYAVADCTGHGVPGAMISVVCSNALTKALLEAGIRNMGKLLDKTRDIVIERLAKSGEEVKDGMDISLCALNMKTKELKWAGANNPLWILRKGAGQIEETKADRQPIGKYVASTPFTEHILQLNEGDIIYTFTDGYQDQFGGAKGKKFMVKKLRELLLSIAHLPMIEQKQQLNNIFVKWKGKEEQVDDVCVIGVKIL